MAEPGECPQDDTASEWVEWQRIPNKLARSQISTNNIGRSCQSLWCAVGESKNIMRFSSTIIITEQKINCRYFAFAGCWVLSKLTTGKSTEGNTTDELPLDYTANMQRESINLYLRSHLQAIWSHQSNSSGPGGVQRALSPHRHSKNMELNVNKLGNMLLWGKAVNLDQVTQLEQLFPNISNTAATTGDKKMTKAVKHPYLAPKTKEDWKTLQKTSIFGPSHHY